MLFPELTDAKCLGFFLPLIEYIVNHLTFCLQTNLDIKAQHLLQTVSIFYQATAGMELTGTVQCVMNVTIYHTLKHI